MRAEYIIIIVVAMIMMILFIMMMIFRKKIFNFQRNLSPTKKVTFAISDLITILGEKDNIVMTRATLTRLRVTVKDLNDVDFDLLKTKFKFKKIDVVLQTIILPFGNESLAIEAEINKLIKKEKAN